jgi:hypothetical protein
MEALGKGFVFRPGDDLPVFFDQDRQISELQTIARLEIFRGGHPGSVEKGAVGRFEIPDGVASVRSPLEFGVVSRDTIILKGQIVVVQAPDGIGAFAEKQFFGSTVGIRSDDEFQGHG